MLGVSFEVLQGCAQSGDGWLILDELAAEDTLAGDSGACSSGVYRLVYSNCI